MAVRRKTPSLLLLFLSAKCAQGCTPKTVSAYSFDLNQFHKWFLNYFKRPLKWKDITPRVVTLWLSDQNISAATRARRAATLKAFARWLHRDKYTKSDLLADLDSPKPRSKEADYLTEDEFKRLLRTVSDAQDDREILPGRDYAILALFLGTGIRLTELAELTLNDVSDYCSEIRVKRKGGKVQKVPVGESTKKALLSWVSWRKDHPLPTPALFISNHLRPMDSQTIRNIVVKWFQRAKIQKKATPHTLRHTYGTYLIKKGVAIHVVKDLMGHRSIQSTERYLHVDSKEKLQAANEVQF